MAGMTSSSMVSTARMRVAANSRNSQIAARIHFSGPVETSMATRNRPTTIPMPATISAGCRLKSRPPDETKTA
jgi:hypothetical protein